MEYSKLKLIPLLTLAALLTACTAQGENRETFTEAPETSPVSISETVTEKTVETENTTRSTSTALPEEPGGYDKAVRLAAEHIEEKGADDLKYILCDLDRDGIPELMEETGFRDTRGWEIYKLTGSAAEDLGCMEFSGDKESFSDIKYYHGDELTLESGVHIYRDREKDEIFHVTEYTTELHTEGHAAGMRYDIYADRMTGQELYRCDFLTEDDLGESGNRYILHNVLGSEKATPMYRCDCNAEGFVYCNEFAGFLSGFEYLGMIDTENFYTQKSGGSFYDYVQAVNIPEKAKDERIYSGSDEQVTVCGAEYYRNSYRAEVTINNDNFDTIDLSELSRLPCLEKLVLHNISDKTADISKLREIDGLTEIRFMSGDFDFSPLAEMDNIIYAENAPVEIISEMPSVKVVSAFPDADNADGFAPLYNMEQLEAVMYNVRSANREQLDRLAERRPDLLLIYVP